ncbi:unnamed protein product [Parnassius apollo]|uniref:(apollo) hypothetical protein n=1 Tax=Parnassius apollo TaxID=110799 RepID=A0A8S3WYC2_PARAO|nr:unnamed protein product [Parnassius apollo]
MSRQFDEDTTSQLLLDDNSDEENCSKSEIEEHLEADPAYEIDGTLELEYICTLPIKLLGGQSPHNVDSSKKLQCRALTVL